MTRTMVKKKSVDSGKSSCSVYIFLGEGFGFLLFGSLPSVWLLRKVGKGNANKILNLGVSRVVVSCPKNWIFRGF